MAVVCRFYTSGREPGALGDIWFCAIEGALGFGVGKGVKYWFQCLWGRKILDKFLNIP